MLYIDTEMSRNEVESMVTCGGCYWVGPGGGGLTSCLWLKNRHPEVKNLESTHPLMTIGRLTAAYNALRRLIMPVAVRSASPSASEPASKRIRFSSELDASSAPPAPGVISALSTASASTSSLPLSTTSDTHGKKKKPSRASKSGPWSAIPTPEMEAASTAACEATMSEPFEFEKRYAYELDYRNKLVLAPMVRSGTLPARLLSLYYGAGLVWTPEIVDKAIIGAQRSVDRESDWRKVVAWRCLRPSPCDLLHSSCHSFIEADGSRYRRHHLPQRPGRDLDDAPHREAVR